MLLPSETGSQPEDLSSVSSSGLRSPSGPITMAVATLLFSVESKAWIGAASGESEQYSLRPTEFD